MKRKVIVECKPDERLVRALGMNRTDVVHQPNKGEVCNQLAKSDIPFAIVDEDPASSQPKFISKLSLVEEKLGIKTLIWPSRNKTLLVLRPRLEEWILSRCHASGISPEKHRLPSDIKRLKDEINYKLDRWDDLLQALLQKKDEGLLYLKEKLNSSGLT